MQALILVFLHTKVRPSTMFRDPAQSINAPPPRYLLESDSSDEEGQGIYPSTAAPGPSSSTRQKSITSKGISTASIQYKTPAAEVSDEVDLLLGVGQAGRYLLKFAGGVQEEPATFDVVYGGVSVGKGYYHSASLSLSKNLVIVVDDYGVPAEGLHTIAETLSQSFKVHSW